MSNCLEENPTLRPGFARLLVALTLLATAVVASAQLPATCASCHGADGNGGVGPKIIRTETPHEIFVKLIREGSDQMPATPSSELSDEQLDKLYTALKTGNLTEAPKEAAADNGVFSTSSCMGCHGQSAMGGLGPPIARLKLTYDQFHKTVREGKGMMPPTATAQMKDEEIQRLYEELKNKPWREDQIPVAYKVGQMLTIKSVSFIFLGVFGLAFLFSIKVLVHWLRNAGLGALWPYVRKLGLSRSAWITVRALLVDGFCVSSLYKRDRFRWLMHGLMLYGFCGLILADILLTIYNPGRTKLPMSDPLKLLPMLSGLSVFTGVMYVVYRYKKDAYVDNGLTLGRDFLFVNLLIQTVLSGFFTVWINRLGAHQYVMPIYIWHLASISLLIVTAPFTRFQHAFLVPCLVAVTRLTEAVVATGVDIGFRREPSPGRHHKSERIVTNLLEQLGPEYDGQNFRLRYFP